MGAGFVDEEACEELRRELAEERHQKATAEALAAGLPPPPPLPPEKIPRVRRIVLDVLKRLKVENAEFLAKEVNAAIRSDRFRRKCTRLMREAEKAAKAAKPPENPPPSSNSHETSPPPRG